MEARSGEKINYPGIIETLLHCMKLIFFSERSLYRLILDYRLSYNIITIFLITLLIPYRLNNGEGLYDIDTVISGIFLTLLYIFILYLFMPKKRVRFGNFFRVFIALEVLSFFSPVTFVLSDSSLVIFTIFILSWYLALSVFVYRKITRFNLVKSIGIVLLSYLISNLIVIVFQSNSSTF